MDCKNNYYVKNKKWRRNGFAVLGLRFGLSYGYGERILSKINLWFARFRQGTLQNMAKYFVRPFSHCKFLIQLYLYFKGQPSPILCYAKSPRELGSGYTCLCSAQSTSTLTSRVSCCIARCFNWRNASQRMRDLVL